MGMQHNNSQASYHYVFSGRVQGVGFRATCRQRAVALGLTGWVRNRFDGKVEALLQGPEEIIQLLVTELQQYSDWIRIDAIEREKRAMDWELRDFRVRG